MFRMARKTTNRLFRRATGSAGIAEKLWCCTILLLLLEILQSTCPAIMPILPTFLQVNDNPLPSICIPTTCRRAQQLFGAANGTNYILHFRPHIIFRIVRIAR